jgi:hypothetical protein
MTRKRISASKGSLTVEASISFSLFLCFFLIFLFLIRTAMIHMTLDHAVSETAKQLAAACYPLKYVNELEDEYIEAGGEASFEEEGYMDGTQSIPAEGLLQTFTDLLTGSLDTTETEQILSSMAAGMQGSMREWIRNYLTRTVGDDYYKVKTRVKQAAVQKLLERNCSSSPVEMENCRLLVIELPQGDAEFNYKNRDPEYLNRYEKLRLLPGQDDVIIAVEYTWKLPLPFFGRTFVSRHIAVEKAWMYGGNGVYTVKEAKEEQPPGDTEEPGNEVQEEEEKQEERNKTVFITKTGTKYHEGDCPRTYLQKSKIPISLFDAKRRGYAPCKVCVTKTAKPLKNGY